MHGVNIGSNPYSEANLKSKGDMETKKIWHTATEIPNGKDRYIFKWKDRNSYKLTQDKRWVESRLQSPTCFDKHIERWAYIKDLESICEQPQQESIDWEQREYDLAKDMFSRMMVAYNTDTDNGRCFRGTVQNIALLKGKTEAVYLADVARGAASVFIERYKENY